LYGLLPFWEACRQAGIHGVVGLSASIEFEEQPFPVVLYAQTNEGYSNLLKISSAVSTRDKGAIPEQWLKAYQAGLICVIPNKAEWLLTDRSEAVLFVKQLFGDRCYGSIERPGGVKSPEEEAFLALCRDSNLDLVATPECRSLEEKDALTDEVASAIGQGLKMNDHKTQRAEKEKAKRPSAPQ